MNKTDLVNEIAAKAQLNKVAAKAALEATLESIEQALANDDKVQLIGFGTFSVVEKEARTGINPQTKEKSRSPRARSLNSNPPQNSQNKTVYGKIFSLFPRREQALFVYHTDFLYFCSLRNCLGNCLNLIAGFYIRFYENRICAASRNRF